jgi:hypothetical protein
LFFQTVSTLRAFVMISSIISSHWTPELTPLNVKSGSLIRLRLLAGMITPVGLSGILGAG